MIDLDQFNSIFASASARHHPFSAEVLVICIQSYYALLRPTSGIHSICQFHFPTIFLISVYTNYFNIDECFPKASHVHTAQFNYIIPVSPHTYPVTVIHTIKTYKDISLLLLSKIHTSRAPTPVITDIMIPLAPMIVAYIYYLDNNTSKRTRLCASLIVSLYFIPVVRFLYCRSTPTHPFSCSTDCHPSNLQQTLQASLPWQLLPRPHILQSCFCRPNARDFYVSREMKRKPHASHG